MKRVRFWGTRGSLPVALTASGVRDKVRAAVRGASGRSFLSDDELNRYVDGLEFPVSGTYGGHTACVELETGSGEYVLCDLGSGARPFAQAAVMRHGAGAPQTYHVFLSHLHWDHIMGMPFFVPAYIEGNVIRIYGGHAELESALRRQQGKPSFPVEMSIMPAAIEYVRLEPGPVHQVAGMSVGVLKQRHSGDSYGYRFTAGGRTVVYTTDSEHRLVNPAETARFVELFRDADLVIFDAMYSLADSISVKADWGHSSNIVGVDLCHLAGARHLCLFHHEPACDDAAIERVLRETRRYEEISRNGSPLHVSAAYDGMEIDW
jgi:phosphoribosyl 1,2-cyclic phosphodiesterase